MSDVDALLEQRGRQWGDMVGTHVRIAQAWTAVLDHEVNALQVALCMAAMKGIRASINPDDPDSFDDQQGYSKIAAVIAGHVQPSPAPVVEVEKLGCPLCGHLMEVHEELGCTVMVTGEHGIQECNCLWTD